MVTHGESATWAVRREVADRRGPLVPALDAHVKLTAAGEGATVITVSGIWQPPLTRLAAGLDPAVVHQVAQATVHGFASYIATDIADPVSASSSPGAGPKALPAGRAAALSIREEMPGTVPDGAVMGGSVAARRGGAGSRLRPREALR